MTDYKPPVIAFSGLGTAILVVQIAALIVALVMVSFECNLARRAEHKWRSIAVEHAQHLPEPYRTTVLKEAYREE